MNGANRVESKYYKAKEKIGSACKFRWMKSYERGLSGKGNPEVATFTV